MTHPQDVNQPLKLHIRRRGRLSRTKARAIEELGPRYMIPGEVRLNREQCFGRNVPLMFEIGFGTGNALLSYAEAHPNLDCVGIEVYQPGIGTALQSLHVRGLDNVRLIEGDARIGLAEVFEDTSLAHAQILFPDPWPKRRHHRRRLIQQDFVSLIVSKLFLAGTLRLATDDAHYAREMLRICDAEPLLRNLAGEGMFVASAEERPKTRFEQRGEALGNEIFELLFERVGARHASPGVIHADAVVQSPDQRCQDE